MTDYSPTSTSDNPLNPDATPVIDTWGPNFISGYWSLEDWVTWHQAMTQTYGLQYANSKFVPAWVRQSWGSAPVNELQHDNFARQYFQQNGLQGIIDPTLSGSLNDFLSGVQNLGLSLPKAGSQLGWLIPLAGVVVGWLLIKDVTSDPIGSAKRAASGAASVAKKAAKGAALLAA